MKAKNSPKKLKPWSSLKKERFQKKPQRSNCLLKSLFRKKCDIPEIVIEALREVSESLGLSIEQIAKKAQKSSSTIHKALGKSAKPTLGTLTAVLKTMGLKLRVERAN